ncbi:MAG: response regulator [Nostoc sp.]|uniref:response regulator n=1 Tax=Nostoc sp. TaxID=1180 RepID=UPI002FFC8619
MLVRRLLYFDQNQQEEMVTTSLEAIAFESVSLLRLKAEEQGVTLFYRSAAEPLPQVPLRCRELGQVMVNLILNAIQPSSLESEVEVGVSQEQDYLVTWVKDTGAGLAPEERDRIFDPFYSTKPQGTGLGLAISHEIVTRHGGHIDLKSQPGCTVFSIYLRRITTMAKILIIDDEKALRQAMAQILKDEGHDVIEAGDGEQGLKIIQQDATSRPDLVFLDLKMLKTQGSAVLKALGSKTLFELPVIVMTAYGTSRTAIEAMQLGAYDYLTKPFDLEDLVNLAQKALAHSQASAEQIGEANTQTLGQPEELLGRSPKVEPLNLNVGPFSLEVAPLSLKF